MRTLVAAATILAGAVVWGAGPAAAQTTAVVTVDLAPAVQARAGQLGRDDLERQRQSLQRQVAAGLERANLPVRSVRLTIQDIQPNRPTPEELGYSPGLSPNSFGLGGAAITGEVIDVGGRAMPVRYRYFPPNLANETNFDTWGDAEQTFASVAQGIASGAPPDQKGDWPPPHADRTITGTLIQH